MEYNFQQIEKAAKQFWQEQQVYKVNNDTSKPKYYVLDMFPYPSGAGLHVGHPLGYIASDIYARFKVMKGFNVLHPMGFDAFGLPAEQYALETGQHPAVTTEKNIARYKEQLDNIGFNYDWSREVRTSDAKYYKWTQWIFVQLFQSWFNRKTQKAEVIENLIRLFETEGNASNPAPADASIIFTAEEWKQKNETEQRAILMHYRLAYLDFAEVWWCEALGTVLANDEVVNGVSERGGHPVEKKKLSQWFLRITEFADRLIDSLNNLEWSEAMKEMQRNWIGKSEGASVQFHLSPTLSKGEGATSGKLPGYVTAEPDAWNANISKAKEMRHEPTGAEAYLWHELRAEKLGNKFRRQHPIGSYIPDFVCLRKKLIVEVDGTYHNTNEQKAYDEQRTHFFEQEGYTVIRFSNEEVLTAISAVLEKIKVTLETLMDTSVPLPFGEGQGGIIEVFTTRPDTIFGVDFMVLAPEHELVNEITTEAQKVEVEKYVTYVRSRSERERQAEKKISGCFTGAYAVHPFTGKQIPVWISEYVLAGYGTGAIMAVPAGDDRDHAFAKHFNIPVTNIFGDLYNGEAAVSDKNVTIQNSDFVSNLNVKEAAGKVLAALEEKGIGTRKINYRLRDAGFSRQRYWGEPFPVVYKGNVPYIINEAGANLPEAMQQLPLELPHVENYKPGPEGEGPLANITDWVTVTNNDGEVLKRETNTMPGYAGSSWYFLRYMDTGNDDTFASKNATDYWNQVDLYIGGTEHAVGHLLYSRMWTKALSDLGFLSFDEPFKRLVNQGMITGKSLFIARSTYVAIQDPNKKITLLTSNDGLAWYKDGSKVRFLYSDELEYEYSGEHTQHRIPTHYTKGSSKIYFEDLKAIIQDSYVKTLFPDINLNNLSEKVLWRDDMTGRFFFAQHYNTDNSPINGTIEVEKMSKSKHNVENPDNMVHEYGADTFRMYEMFLGPIDVSKPWDTKGIEGVHRFLKKFWRLFNDEQTGWKVTDEAATDAELKVLHKTIQKIESDTERFSFNTAVSQFMICVNDLMELKCNKRAILEPLVRIITPYAPHIAEELWKQLGNNGSVIHAAFPEWEQKYTVENSKMYPVSVNGKARTQLEFDLDADPAFVEAEVLANPVILKWLDGQAPKKFIYVKGRMINVVV